MAQGLPPSGGGAPGAGNRPVQLVAQSPLSIRRLIGWAWSVVAGVAVPFYTVTFLSLLTILLTQYNSQLLVNFAALAEKEVAATEAARNDEGLAEAASTAGDAAEAPAATAPEEPAATTGEAGEANGKSRSGSLGFISALLPSGDRALEWTAALFAGTSLLVVGFSFLNRVGTVWLNTIMLQVMQLRIHDKLVQLGPSYHARHDQGENTQTVLQYASSAVPMLRDVLAFPFVRGISLATALVLLFYNLLEINARLAEQGESGGGVMYVLLLVVLVILPVGGWLLSRRLRTANVAVREQQNQLSNTLVDSLTAPQEVQLLDAGPRRSAAFAARLKELARAQVRAVVQSETSNQFQAAVPQVLVAGFIVWAIFLVAQEGPAARVAAIQAVLAIYLFVPRVVQPIQEMIQFYSTLNIAWPSVEKVGMLLEEPPEVQDTGKKTATDLKGFDIVLDKVTYRPKPELTVLDGVSFKFHPGTITALIGRSGSGKTSILRLISRLSDPQGGNILIGGVDAREFRLSALRSMSATVSQFPLFIEADVRENLRLGVPNATDAAMGAACREADLWPALERLSPHDPLATPVARQAGKGGLAGGERRRLAIARALLADPRILLLDEPSTGIDVMSVGKIADAIHPKPGQTVILVEHNIPLVRALATQVVCLEDGRFTDIGTPEELLARPTLFRQLAEEWQRLTDTSEMEVQGSIPVRAVEGGDARAIEGGAGRTVGGKGARPGGVPPGPGGARASRAAPAGDGKGASQATAPAGKAPAGDRNG